MTIEQEFFEAFEIEKIRKTATCLNHYNFNSYEKDYCEKVNNNCFKCKFNYNNDYYPSITPEIVLGLERIIAQYFEEEGGYQFLVITSDGYSVGNIINGKQPIFDDYYSLLKLCTDHQDEIQDQVRGLFNGK